MKILIFQDLLTLIVKINNVGGCYEKRSALMPAPSQSAVCRVCGQTISLRKSDSGNLITDPHDEPNGRECDGSMRGVWKKE